jgi:hypothetical protein
MGSAAGVGAGGVLEGAGIRALPDGGSDGGRGGGCDGPQVG